VKRKAAVAAENFMVDNSKIEVECNNARYRQDEQEGNARCPKKFNVWNLKRKSDEANLESYCGRSKVEVRGVPP
jgi:hypothetical protein